MQGHKTVHWFQDILSLHCPIFYIIRWNSIFCANTSATGDNATSKTHSPHSVWCCNVSIYLTWHKNPGQLQANCQPDICRTHRWKYMWPYFTKYIWVTPGGCHVTLGFPAVPSNSITNGTWLTLYPGYPPDPGYSTFILQAAGPFEDQTSHQQCTKLKELACQVFCLTIDGQEAW